MVPIHEFPVTSAAEVENVRRQVRAIALGIGFNRFEIESIVVAVSELATNLVRYAQNGRITVASTNQDGRAGAFIESVDDGPGIANIDEALQDGFSTGGGLGHGLPGTRRLMDEFEISSGPGGTRIKVCKWLSVRAT